MLIPAHEEPKSLSRESLRSCEIWPGPGYDVRVWKLLRCSIFEFLAPSCGKCLFLSTVGFFYFVDREKKVLRYFEDVVYCIKMMNTIGGQKVT